MGDAIDGTAQVSGTSQHVLSAGPQVGVLSTQYMSVTVDPTVICNLPRYSQYQLYSIPSAVDSTREIQYALLSP